MSSTQRMFDRFDQLAAITDEPGLLCRTFLSPAMLRANDLVREWMEEAGCTVTVDGWGNLIGRLKCSQPNAKTLLLGSHLDTVRNAGKYDGPLGIIVAIEVLSELQSKKVELPYHVEVLGFSDEEGTRFQSAYMGSKAVAGLISDHDLDLMDSQNISVLEAVSKFQETDHLELPQCRYRPDNLMGYIELHIEQGPVLEDMDRSLGVVDHIAAQNRFLFVFDGAAGHAGTTPMKLRRDALPCAAEFVLLVENIGVRTQGLVATVGKLEVSPGVGNVIPARVRLSVDIRHADIEMLQRASAEMQEGARELSRRRGIGINGTLVQGTISIPCSPRLIERLAWAIDPIHGHAPHLVSGAGHDGVILSEITDVGMIFVRCTEGISHNPLESVLESDLEEACQALCRFLRDAV